MPDQQIDYDKLAAEIQGFSVSHDAVSHEARPVSTGGGRGTGLDVRKSDQWLKDSAPALGAGAAVMAGPAGWIASPVLAGGGAYLGSRLRGDERGPATVEGIKQMGLQVAGDAVGAVARPIASGLMKGTVPKNIAKNFDQVDLPQEMLDRHVVPGFPAAQRRVARLSTAANAERDAAAATVPVMPRGKVVEGLRPLYQKGVRGKVPEMSDATLEQMRQSAREIGPEGLTGPEALARKDIKQAQGNASINASDPRRAAFGSQLADAERGSIVSHLRETPRMGAALDDSQALMGIDQVMQEAALSNPVTRMGGGLANMVKSPAGLGLAAHAVNLGSKAVSPQMLRAIQIAMLNGEQQ